jgi:hypothetical protein
MLRSRLQIEAPLKPQSTKLTQRRTRLAAGLAILLAGIGCGKSAAKDGGNDAQGIRHQISISIKFQSPPAVGQSSAFLKVRVKISDFALESRFVGNVTTAISDFDPTKGIVDHIVWEDSKCHHERGLPKATILEVSGSLKKDQQGEVPIAATIRRTGLLAPFDQVTAPAALIPGSDGTSSYYLVHVETTKSRIMLDLKMRAVPCTILSDHVSGVLNDSE